MQSCFEGKEEIMPISCMLLDLQMPDKTGIEVIESVRKMYAQLNKDLRGKCRIIEPRFVFLTAHATTDFIRHAMETLKVEAVFEKPLRVEQLKQILRL